MTVSTLLWSADFDRLRVIAPATQSTSLTSKSLMSCCVIPHFSIDGPIDFTVSHPTFAPASLNVSATSSNSSLFPNAGLVLTNLGNGAWRLVATPAADRNGSAVITVLVSDGTLTYAESFTRPAARTTRRPRR